MAKVHCDKLLLKAQYEQNRIGRNWYRFGLLSLYKLPRLPCCYVVYGDGKIVYIGSTVDLRKRFDTGGHKPTSFTVRVGGKIVDMYKSPWGEFTDLYIKVRFSDFIGDWAQKEIYLIYRLRPSGNLTYNWK